MLADKQGHKTVSNIPEGNPYFELKATLQFFITEKKWSNLEHSSRNMIAVYPDADFGWFTLGLALSRQGDYTAAILNLKKALYLNPDLMSADYQLGITSYRQQNYLQAIHHFEAAKMKGMDTHYLYYNLGNSWYKEGKVDSSIKCYLRSLSICPDFTPAAYGLFRIYFSNHDYQNAVASLRPVISDDKLPSYLLAQARLLYENESETNFSILRQALKLLNSAIDLDDKFALAYYERAYVKTRLGDIKGFAHDKVMAFQLNPELRKGHLLSLFSTSYL